MSVSDYSEGLSQVSDISVFKRACGQFQIIFFSEIPVRIKSFNSSSLCGM